VAKKRSSSSEIINSGRKANKTGNLLENFVEQSLKAKGYREFWNHKEQLFSNCNAIGGKQYGKQVLCGKTIYETDRKVDFFIVNQDVFPNGLIIECKWQQVSGSVDEKYPFLLFNIIKTAVPTVILIDGNGYRKAALNFLKTEVSKTSALRGAWTMREFQTEINNGFLG
jgi:hypothetical protein